MPAFTSKTKVQDLPLNITANGKYLIEVSGAAGSPGNFSSVYAIGSFGGGTVSVEVTPDATDDTKNVPVSASDLLASGFVNVVVKSRGLVIDLTGATTPNIEIWVL